MIKVINKDMDKAEPITDVIERALKGGYDVSLQINGEYYEVIGDFKRSTTPNGDLRSCTTIKEVEE